MVDMLCMAAAEECRQAGVCLEEAPEVQTPEMGQPDENEIREARVGCSRLEPPPELAEISSLILQAAGDGIYGLDANGFTTFANPAAEAMTGWKAEELFGKYQHAILHHAHANGKAYPRDECPIYMALRDGRTHRSDSEVFWRKDGTSFPVAYTSTPLLRGGRPVGAVVLFQDITERKRREAWEKAKNEIFLAVTKHEPLETTLAMIGSAYIALHPSRSIAFSLRSGSKLRVAAQAGLPDGIQRSISKCGDHPFAMLCVHAAEQGKTILIERGSGEDAELAEGNFRSCLAIPLSSGAGRILGTVAVFESCCDLPDRSRESVDSVCDLARLAIEHDQLQTQLVRQTQHDHLTGLANRLLLEDRLKQAIMQAKRHGRHVGVCFVDLDRFKQINDALGHSAGDLFLQHVASVLATSVREIDTVARQGGDEFILVLPDLDSEREAEQICERVLSGLRKRITIERHMLAPSASIGISVYPADGESGSVLLQNADTALYVAKRAGKDRARRYESRHGAEAQREVKLETALRFALEQKQFHVVYQPLYSMSNQLKGFEALLRWHHPELGPVSPGQFIPMAEETGLIVAIGEWVLEQACRQAREWYAGLPEPITIFVNVSGVQLNRAEFTASIARVLSETGLDARSLELEVTESWIVADPEAAVMQLQRLRDLGIGIGIDDFGTGHSSLSILQQLPVDTLKIDQSFIARLDGSATGSAIIRTIVDLAQQLGLDTVAEGVETGQQLEELRTTQCSLLQGYLFAKPLSPEAASLLLPVGVGVTINA